MATQDLITTSSKIKTPIKTIRAKCLDCSGGSSHEVRLCVIPECVLYPYRLGKNPNCVARVMTEEQKEAARIRLRENTRKKFHSTLESRAAHSAPIQLTLEGVQS